MGGSKGRRYIFTSFVPAAGIHEDSYQYIKQSLFVNEIYHEIILPDKFVFDTIINHFNYVHCIGIFILFVLVIRCMA
ncbi:MAG: hypothetical protein A2545_02765 [Planctomycetes bacterium RIFOXYD2_FULL_41_16]|nr:MAG: hypothetical protein A2545_02765 [Planctomycetes bacterium RIFOXYD2_FULL_41_16]